MNEITNTDRTAQTNAYEPFGEIDIKTLVSQITGRHGTRKAQITFACGFQSSPPKNARLQVVEIGSAIYAIGGYCPAVQEELGLEDGESAIFSTDADGVLKSKTIWHADGSIVSSNENGSSTLNADGTTAIGDGDDAVAQSELVDQFITMLDDFMTTSVDPLTSGAWSAIKLLYFTEGIIPTSASDNLSAEYSSMPSTP